MANVAYYDNRLRSLLDNPASITQDPSYGFGLDQAAQAVQRSNSRQRGSGNALAALVKLGEGYAASRYGENVDRYGRLLGQEQQYGLGERAATNAETATANNMTLGTEQNRLTGIRDANSMTLGTEQNRLTGVRDTNADILGHKRADQDYGVSLLKTGNDFELGKEQNANTAQRNWWDNVNTRDANSIAATGQENTWNLGRDRNAIDWYNADTNRASARSSDYVNRQRLTRGY